MKRTLASLFIDSEAQESWEEEEEEEEEEELNGTSAIELLRI